MAENPGHRLWPPSIAADFRYAVYYKQLPPEHFGYDAAVDAMCNEVGGVMPTVQLAALLNLCILF